MNSTLDRTRPPIERFWKIHEALATHQAPNCRTLARDLAVDARTIQRDLDFMRDRLGLPIVYDEAAHAFHYASTVTEIPAYLLTEKEFRTFSVAQSLLKLYPGTPYADDFALSLRKLAAKLDSQPPEAPLPHFAQSGIAPSDSAIYAAIDDAITQRLTIHFAYHKLETDTPIRRHVEPLALVHANHATYLLAHDRMRKARRCFALTRIQPSIQTGEPFTPPTDFDPAAELTHAFGIFTGEDNVDPIHVQLEFAPFSARLVRERQWHHSQTLEDLPDGRLQLTLHLGALEEIERWILSWGPECRVLAPATLQHRIRQKLFAAHAHYVESSPDLIPLQDLDPETDLSLILAHLQHLARASPENPNQLPLPGLQQNG